MTKLTYHPSDLLKNGMSFALLLDNGRVAPMKPDSFPGAEELYNPDGPIKTSPIKDIKWVKAVDSVIYILDEDVVCVDDPDKSFGKLCIVVPKDKLDLIKPLDEVI